MKRIQATSTHPLPRSKRTLKVRKNGIKAVDAASTMKLPLSSNSRVTRNQAFMRWQYPGVAAFTPAYVEMILRGALAGDHVRQWELFDLMLQTWPTLASCQQELLYGIERRELVFDPYSEEDKLATPSAIEKEKLVTTLIRGMRPDPASDENEIKGMIKNIMDAWFRGVSVIELLWEPYDIEEQGLVNTPRASVWAHPSNYAFDPQGNMGLVNQSAGYPNSTGILQPPYLRPFPPNRFLICIHKCLAGSPMGGALLKPLAWWWCAANFSSDWLLNLAQVFGLPFRWASFAASTPDQTVTQICDMLQNMGSAGWAAFPEGTTMELKEASRSGNLSPQGDLLDRADTYARMLILGQTMTGATIASGRGGQAFGTVEAQLKQDRLDAASQFVETIINQQLIPAIMRLNYGDDKEAPTCRFLQETIGTYQDAQRDQILAGPGIAMPIPFSHLRAKYAIPEPTGGEEVTKPPPIPTAAPFGGGGGNGAGPKGTRPIGQSADPKQKTKPADKKKVEAKLAEISLIEDDALFAHELRALAAELVSSQEISDAREAVSAIQNFITQKEAHE
jgi:phage gp29-like protein